MRRGKRWNSCMMWFVTSVGALCLTVCSFGAADEPEATNFDQFLRGAGQVPVPPPCAQSDFDVDAHRKVMLVSTLDGKLSALDVREDGKLLWSVSADARPLLSSSISKLEIMHDGVPTRYIPALDGGLYRYDGESIENVPMSADTLLSASYRLADNTVMIGGKDTLSYGLDPKSGKVRYACGVDGCHTFGDGVATEDDVIVVSRETRTVRAVDSRTGSEKWNFSVGLHEMTFLQGQKKVITSQDDANDDASVEVCLNEDEEPEEEVMEALSRSLKIIVPEGMVIGLDPDNMQTVTWQHKFASPVSNVWLLYKGALQPMDMFEGQNIPALSSVEPDEQPLHQPSLYVGMHEKQLYVQPSSQMQQRVKSYTDRYNHDQVSSATSNLPRVVWKPYLNTAHWRTPSMRNPHPEITYTDDSCPPEGDCSTSQALTIWHENYPFDNGFYLYPEFSVPIPPSDPEQDYSAEANHSHQFEPSMLDDYLPVTLWNWWKEVIFISLVTSVIVNLVLSHVMHKHAALRNALQDSKGSNQSTSSSAGKSDSQDVAGNTDLNSPSRQDSEEKEYVSRYAADFEHIQILGKGGFGVVFETRNKVDDCHYAVKRIALPNSEGAKEKVMREVKALAKLDHHGIVRYFHAWLESPPLGWQEARDRELEDSECGTSPSLGNGTSQFDSKSCMSKTPTSLSVGIASKLGSGLSSRVSPKHSPKQTSPLDFLQNPFGGSGLELSQSDTAIKRGGSEEFSVLLGSQAWSDDDESGSFSCGMGTPKLTALNDDSSTEIEFKRVSDCECESESGDENCNNCGKLPGFAVVKDNTLPREHKLVIDDTGSSCPVLFEDSGCADKSSKDSTGDICIGIQTSQSDFNSKSHDCQPSNHSSAPSRSRTHSRSHSRTPSKDLAKLTYEQEGVTNNTNKKPKEQPSDHVRNCGSPGPKLQLYIQMQLCKRETLKDWLNAHTLNRDRHMVLDMFDQIVCAVEYVHDCGLMHRDLKPSNIFFSLDGVIKMGDFGLATALPEEDNEALYGGPGDSPYRKHTAQVGTQLYMSPEQLSGASYSKKVDIFSLGLILFELLYPFATQMERVNTLLGVKQQRFPDRFCREMHTEHEFLQLLLALAPEERPTATQILSCSLLKEFESRRMPHRFRARTVSQNSS